MRYGELSLKLNQAARAQRIPINGVLELTHRCPFACTHCYNRLAPDDAARARELTLEDYLRILDELSQAGCLWLLLTGGEIFLRADFLAIYTAAKERGFLVTLFTNAALLDDALADALVELRPFSLEVSLYGATAPVCDCVTRTKGAFDLAMRGIERARARKLPLKLKTLVTRENAHELPALRALAEDTLGLEFRYDAAINARIDGHAGPLDVRLTPAEVADLDVSDARRREAWARRAPDPCRAGAPPAASTPARALFECGGGVNAFAIDPYGRLTPCSLYTTESYDLGRGTFAAGWEFLRGVVARPRTRTGPCAACAAHLFCELCPACAALETGDPEAVPEFFCATAKRRAAAFMPLD
jgi:radical SAM protein with 4Fe4S-binding SPASM domain